MSAAAHPPLPDGSRSEDAMDELQSLQPGQTLVYDHRLPGFINSDDRRRKLPDTFRVVQWNVERGAKLPGIIRSLRACEADIVVLQELDINCRRSGYANVPRAIAEALHMQCVFVCEFEELDDAARAPHNAVGPLSAAAAAASVSGAEGSGDHAGGEAGRGRHFHGNAILSRCADLRGDVCVIRHSGDFDWEVHGVPLKEPRHGFRCALRVRVSSADRSHPTLPPLFIYCCHLEVFCGALTRVRQLSDCLADAKRILREAIGTDKGDAAAPLPGSRGRAPSFIIAGDLNTMAHNVVRLSPKFARDRLRFLSVGETEAMWLQRKVLSRGFASIIRGCCPFSCRFPSYLVARLYKRVFDSAFVWRALYGFTPREIAAMDNTETCFYDPSDKFTSVTLDSPEYRGFVRGKLDWLLLSNLTPRPFRVSRGGARPVDLDTLIAMHSVDATGGSAAYLRRIYAPDAKTARRYPDDEARELHEADAVACTPAEGYVLFNENYIESDHKGLLMTIQQSGRTSSPTQTYPPYGAPYTSNLYAIGSFLVSRAIPLALVAAAGMRMYERVRRQ